MANALLKVGLMSSKLQVVGSVPATYSQVIVAGPCEVQFVGVSIVRAEIKGVTNANKQILENIVVVVVKECKANYSSGMLDVWLQYYVQPNNYKQVRQAIIPACAWSHQRRLVYLVEWSSVIEATFEDFVDDLFSRSLIWTCIVRRHRYH